jgi:hypothetical protein
MHESIRLHFKHGVLQLLPFYGRNLRTSSRSRTDMHRGDGDLMNGSTLAGHRPYHWRLREVVGEDEADYCQ